MSKTLYYVRKRDEHTAILAVNPSGEPEFRWVSKEHADNTDDCQVVISDCAATLEGQMGDFLEYGTYQIRPVTAILLFDKEDHEMEHAAYND